MEKGFAKGLEKEAKEFGELVMTLNLRRFVLSSSRLPR
ncbi:hypothetical protein JCM19232_5825 [Vibrio ishigakensis]|uniref:Uncharacterized protein n=1 Tax=Vibrio ishigakensis TaxID=1481914 RepID=A0A0B8PFC2_9VIBR|nr:hypothetical protein JCM19232_5825 [Vibrio ishigakensis]